MSTLLPIEAIDARLLDAIGREFIKEDAARVAPSYWQTLSKASMEACQMEPDVADTTPAHAAMILSAMNLLEKNGISVASVGGIIIKSIVAGWRMAEMHLLGGCDDAKKGKVM